MLEIIEEYLLRINTNNNLHLFFLLNLVISEDKFVRVLPIHYFAEKFDHSLGLTVLKTELNIMWDTDTIIILYST